MKINITDLFGIEIKETKTDLNIILIEVLEIERVLIPIIEIPNEGTIYRPNLNIINNYLAKKGLSDEYLPFGDIWIKSNFNKIIFPMGYSNSAIFSVANSFVASYKLKKGIIWTPNTDKNNYHSLGCIFSLEYPKKNNILLIKKPYCDLYKGTIKKGNFISTQSEFPLLSTIKSSPYTINRCIFFNKRITSWLYHRASSLVLDINFKLTKNRKLENKAIYEKNKIQMGNKFLRVNDKNQIFFSTKGSSWYPFYNSNGCILVLNCSNRCLGLVDNLTLINMNSQTNNKYWDFENDIESVIDNTEYLGSRSWTTEEGNGVTLTVPEDPWYQNRESQLDPEMVVEKPKNIIKKKPKTKIVKLEKSKLNYSNWYIILGFILVIAIYFYVNYYLKSY